MQLPGSLLGVKGIFTVFYLSYIPPFHIFCFSNQSALPSPGKGGPGVTVPVSEQNDTH